MNTSETKIYFLLLDQILGEGLETIGCKTAYSFPDSKMVIFWTMSRKELWVKIHKITVYL